MSCFTRAALLLFGSTAVFFQGCGCDDRPALGEDCHTADEHTEPLTCKEEGNDCLKSDGSKCTSGDTAGCSCKARQPAVGAMCHTSDPRAEPLTCSGDLNKCFAEDGTSCMKSHTAGCICKRDCTASFTQDQCLADEHCKWSPQKKRRGRRVQASCSAEEKAQCETLRRKDCDSRERDQTEPCIWKNGVCKKRCFTDVQCEGENFCIRESCEQKKCTTNNQCYVDNRKLYCLLSNKLICPQNSESCVCSKGVPIDNYCALEGTQNLLQCQEGNCVDPETQNVCDPKMLDTQKKKCKCLERENRSKPKKKICAEVDFEGKAKVFACDDNTWCLSKYLEDCSTKKVQDAMRNRNFKRAEAEDLICHCKAGRKTGDSCFSPSREQEGKEKQVCHEKNSRCLARDGSVCKDTSTCFCLRLDFFSQGLSEHIRRLINAILQNRQMLFILNQQKRVPPTRMIVESSAPYIGVLRCTPSAKRPKECANDRTKAFQAYKTNRGWAKASTPGQPIEELIPLNMQWITYEYTDASGTKHFDTYFYTSVPMAYTKLEFPVHSELLRLVDYHNTIKGDYAKIQKLDHVKVGGGSSPCETCTAEKIHEFYAYLSADFGDNFATSFEYDHVYEPKIKDFTPPLFFSRWVHTLLDVHLRPILEKQSDDQNISFLTKMKVAFGKARKLQDYENTFADQNFQADYQRHGLQKTLEDKKQTNGAVHCTTELDTFHEKVKNLPKALNKDAVVYACSQWMYDCLGQEFFNDDNLKDIIVESVNRKIFEGKKKGVDFAKTTI